MVETDKEVRPCRPAEIDVHADQIVGLRSFQRGTKRLDCFSAVYGDVTFAVAGKECLEQKPAGEVVFHQKHSQMRGVCLLLAHDRSAGGIDYCRGIVRMQPVQSGQDLRVVSLVTRARVLQHFKQSVSGTQQHADPGRRRMRIPMMSISRSEVMAISAERSDARLFQCETVIDIRQVFCWFSVLFICLFFRR